MSAPPTDPITTPAPLRRDFLAKWIRRLAVPIIVGWIALIVVMNTSVPQLEVVGQMRAVSMSPKEAPSVIAMQRVGQVFDEFKSDSSAMIVLEGEKPLGDDSHHYYNELVDQARGRQEARRTRPGLLGRPADRSRRTERRRKSRVRAGVPRRQHGRGAVQRVGRGRSKARQGAYRRRPGSRCT